MAAVLQLLHGSSPQAIQCGKLDKITTVYAATATMLSSSTRMPELFSKVSLLCVICLQHFYHVIDKIMFPLCGEDDECNAPFLRKK
jgi:hypothetical protein